MEKLIDIDHVTAAYGNKTVLRDISLTIWKDDFLGIIGPNGGGKTTLLKVILGLLKPFSGEIVYHVTKQSLFLRQQVPQGITGFTHLPRNVRLIAMLSSPFPATGRGFFLYIT